MGEEYHCIMKKNTTILTATLFMLLTCSSAWAQSVVMGLKDCMEYAVSHSNKVKMQQADYRDAQINRREAILTAFTPSVEAGSYAYTNFGRSIDPETNTYIRTTSFHNGYSLSAGMVLFNGFQAVNNLKITKTAEKMGLTKTWQLQDQICLATMEAYCNVVYYAELSAVLQAQVGTADTALLLARRQEELGQKSHADVVQMQADLADRQYQLTNCRNCLNDAFITLKDVMFWPMEDSLAIDLTVSELPMLLDKTGPVEVKVMAEEVRQSLPQVLLAKGGMENARLALMTARWQLLPRLSLYGGWSSSYFTYPGQAGYVVTPFFEQIKNNRGQYVQLSLSIPIFDRLSRCSNIGRKKNAYQRAVAEYEQTLQEVDAEVRRAVADRDGASQALNQADIRATLQQEAYALNAKSFENGLISSIEYQTASNNYLNALAEKLNARLQYFIKNSVVKYYQGTSYLEQF